MSEEVDDGDSINVSTKLYIFTFIATLFLLLAISTLIVFRSLVVRRRLERRINAAIQQGLVITPRNPGSRRKRFTKRPKIHDSWMICGGETWDEVMPLSIQRLKPSRKVTTRLPNSSKESRYQRLLAFIHQDTPPTSEDSDIQKGTGSTTPCQHLRSKGYPSGEELLQVSVLVAMPTPFHNTSGKAGNGEDTVDCDSVLPEVAIGVAQLPITSDSIPGGKENETHE